MDSTLDLIELGNKIRQIRKNKGLNQQDVWEGLFSAGKYSEIERGLGKVTQEDLEKICKRLNVKMSYLIPQEEDLEALKLNINTAIINIKMGLYEVAKECLNEIQDRAVKSKGMHIFYMFAWGEYFLRKKQYKKAEDYLQYILKRKVSAFFDRELVLRSYNALIYISYKQDNLGAASEYVTKGLHFLDRNVEEFRRDRSFTHFNNAIFQFRLKNYEAARDSAYEALRLTDAFNKDRFQLLLHFINIQANTHPRTIKKMLCDLSESFVRNNDIPNYYRANYCLYLLQDKSKTNVATNFLMKIGDKLANEINFPSNNTVSNDDIRDDFSKVEYLYILSNLAYLEGEYANASKLITVAFSYAENSEDEDRILLAKIYGFYAKICKVLKVGEDQEREFLQKALDCLEDYPDSIERAVLLHEKLLLDNKSNLNDPATQALSAFYNAYNKAYKDSSFLSQILPRPIY